MSRGIGWWISTWWLCRLRGRHQLKMDSRGRCIRCNREIE